MHRHLVQGIWWHIRTCGNAARPALVLLHGLTGSMATWDPLLPALSNSFHILLVDLPGHGKTGISRDPHYSFDRLTHGLKRLIPAAVRPPVLLCGYSMGGRVALQLTLDHPRIVRGLALIGASPGIESPNERAERKRADEALADQTLLNGVRWFADHWAALPMFESQKHLAPAIQEQIRAQRLACTAQGLAFALRRLGTGAQENLWARLYDLRCPLLLMAGGLDHKFQESNHRIRMRVASRILFNVVVADAGHAVQTEDPHSVAQALIDLDHTITREELA